jgi:hypothetical protein
MTRFNIARLLTRGAMFSRSHRRQTASGDGAQFKVRHQGHGRLAHNAAGAVLRCVWHRTEQGDLVCTWHEV